MEERKPLTAIERAQEQRAVANTKRWHKWLSQLKPKVNNGKLVLVQCGDYIETFGGHAKQLSRVIGCTLLDAKLVAGHTNHCFFPAHSLNTNIAAIEKAGIDYIVVPETSIQAS